MSCVLDCVPEATPFTRLVASLTGCELHTENGHTLLHLVRGKGNALKSKWYRVNEIETQLGGRAFRLTPAIYSELAHGETDYVVLLDGRDSSCTCPGHTYTGGCSHLSALLHFHAESRLEGTVTL